ncbi:helix-turn-helix domain-containing protein [Nonomuraea sp. B12E4]|uniref:helix-turn-helix domain-containing protein n=1 Tax=Nonomuraea sp. B12E4 TaxID=3153564 RepID=UPI00325DAD12
MAQLLRDLKERSGHSYEWIGRKVNASKSTVHRYCSGESIPPSFGMVEQIALACKASRADLIRLHRLWVRATEIPARAAPADPAPAPDPRGEEPVALEAAMPSAAHRAGGTLDRVLAARRWQRLFFASAGLVVVCFLVVTASAARTSEQLGGGMQRVTGPSWVRPPAPVPDTLFGVTINSATGAMPDFRMGAVRLWDSATRWSQLQPRRGEFDWSTLDRHVRGAREAGLPVLLAFGGTPGWASPTGPAAPYPDGARAAPPDDLADWDAFVKAVVKRYQGRIEAYELWALGNDHRFYSGDVLSLVELSRRASGIIRATDPRATIVCPGMGRLWTREGRDAMHAFARLGGYAYCDVASVKLYQRSASDPPETMLELVASIDRLLHEAGVHPRVWNTGTTYTIRLDGRLDATTARNYAARFYLVGLYARDLNLERMYFYNWGSTKIPVVLQGEEGLPTSAALAVEELQRWLHGAASRSCGQGRAVGLPENVWQCELILFAGDRGTHPAFVMWTINGTAEITARPGTDAVRHLDGTRRNVQPGEAITLGEEPILVEYRQ